MLRGPMITGLLARGIEQHIEGEGRRLETLLPARTTFDLHSAVPIAPLQTRTKAVKSGRSLTVIDAELIAGDEVVARARASVLRATPEDHPDVSPHFSGFSGLDIELKSPDAETSSRYLEGVIYSSESSGWFEFEDVPRDEERKYAWALGESMVEGEAMTSYQRVASLADLTNFVANGGKVTREKFINVDMTLSLARLPDSGGVGVVSLARAEHAGISVGNGLLYDSGGVIGAAVTSGMIYAYRPSQTS